MSYEDFLEDEISLHTASNRSSTTANILKSQMLAYDMGFENATTIITTLATVYKHRVLLCKPEDTDKYRMRHYRFSKSRENLHPYSCIRRVLPKPKV
ncbi:hypothetical protein INT43_000076 [Umbelopsis isabellina]|uniref:Uncharacterized protein n=1 Tax=Mortierella isabellina TaxID=91625 RepID=A0A8H7PFJ1_MORIS|nr:hypothetical protein INT43_000076 [Umbelopsis isabellina]